MPKERELARDVFHNTLPPLEQIGISNGLGKDEQIFTMDRPFNDYLGAP